MDRRNRVTRLTLSRDGAGNQPQAQTGEMAQEANAFGKAEGYADVGRVYGKARVLDEQRSYDTRLRRSEDRAFYECSVLKAHLPSRSYWKVR